jgi:hypothetical protein
VLLIGRLSLHAGNSEAYQKAYALAQRSLELEKEGDLNGSTIAYLASCVLLRFTSAQRLAHPPCVLFVCRLHMQAQLPTFAAKADEAPTSWLGPNRNCALSVLKFADLTMLQQLLAVSKATNRTVRYVMACSACYVLSSLLTECSGSDPTVWRNLFSKRWKVSDISNW